MKIAVDEHILLMTVRALQDLGHDVRDIRGTADEGMQDEELWEMVQREARLLITTDRGFTHYRTVPHYGILVVRQRIRRANGGVEALKAVAAARVHPFPVVTITLGEPVLDL